MQFESNFLYFIVSKSSYSGTNPEYNLFRDIKEGSSWKEVDCRILRFFKDIKANDLGKILSHIY